jgi:hypothetical protein
MPLVHPLVELDDIGRCHDCLRSTFADSPLAAAAERSPVQCLAPATVDPATFFRFDRDTDDDLLVEVVLASGEDRFAVFDNALSRPTDPVVSRFRSRVVPVGDRVLHALVGPASVEAIATTIRESRNTPEWAAVLGEGRNACQALTNGALVVLESVQFALAGISDGESFVMCRMRPAASTAASESPRSC